MNQQHRNFMSALGPSAVNPAARAILGQNNNTSSGNATSLPNVDSGGAMDTGYPGSGQSQGLSPWAKQQLQQLGFTEEQINQWAALFGPPSPYAEPANPEYLIQLLVDGEMKVQEDGRLCHVDVATGGIHECYSTPTTDPDPGDPDPGDPDPPDDCGDWPEEYTGIGGVVFVLDRESCTYSPKTGGDEPGEPGEPGGGCEDWEQEIVGPDNTIMVLDPVTCSYGPKNEWPDPEDPGPGGGDPERPQPGGPGGGLFPNPIEDMWWKMIQDAMSGDWVDDLNQFLKEEADRKSEAMRRDKDRDLVRDIMEGLGGGGDGSGGSDRIGPVGLFNLATGGGGRYQDAQGEQGKGPVVSSGTVQATPQVPSSQISQLGQTSATPAAASTTGGAQQFSDILGGAAAPMQTQLTAALGQQANNAQFQEKSAHAQRGQDIASQVQQLGAQSDKLAQAKKRQKISQTMPLIQATLQGTDIFKNK